MGIGTTGIMAKNQSGNLVKLASQQEILSKNIMKAYGKKDNGMAALAVIQTLENGQMKLKSDIHNAEIDNLLVFLGVCLGDLKKAVQQPYTPDNVSVVADLSASISEGNHYIAQAL